MIFIMGINSGRKDLAFHQTMVCGRCGRYSSYSVYMTYTVLTLFFIPIFRWNRRYFVTTGCCGAVYRLDPDVGKRIVRGEEVKIMPEDLSPLYGDGDDWNSHKASSWDDRGMGENACRDDKGIRENAAWKNNWKEENEEQQENTWYISSKTSERQPDPNDVVVDIDAKESYDAKDMKDVNERQEESKDHLRKCPACGYVTDEEDFAYCPKCGTKL